MKTKLRNLRDILRQMGSMVVAYSGGVDSTFLLKVAGDVLGNKVLAVTATSPTYTQEELFSAKRMAALFGVRHRVIKTHELENKRFAANPVNRCYFCKKELFSELKSIAKTEKFNFVAEASNISDAQDFRPGVKAKQELKVRSPLVEADLSKEQIRNLSKQLGLSTWDKPNLACLASRIPYGKPISREVLARVDKAEAVLRELGIRQVRVRHHENTCRIEVLKNDIPVLINKSNLVVKRLKQLGYNYITLDLEGYRVGSMNEILKK